jgi:RNA recognition motif-containing protein
MASKIASVPEVKTTAMEVDADDEADSGTSFSIYVKNLNFSTTEEQLRAGL